MKRFNMSRRAGTAGAAVCGGLSLLNSQPAQAALILDQQASPVQTTYDANILATDLINNGSAARSGTPATNGNVATYPGDVAPFNSFANLTDGGASTKVGNNDISKDTYFDGTAYPSNPSITYTLNTAANPQGYSLTQIRSIAGWADTRTFSNQKYTVSLALVGAPTVFTTLKDVNLTAFPDNNGTPNSSQVTLTDDTGTIQTGVAAIRFAFLDNGGNGQVFREIDVVGAPTQAPEPASVSLLAVAALATLRRRRRR